MQPFKPFRSTALRKRKYQTQKRRTENSGSIFNLPNEIIERESPFVIDYALFQSSRQNKRSSSQQNKSLLHQNQGDFKSTAKNNSFDLMNQNGPTFSLISVEKIKSLEQKMNRNRSFDCSHNKKMPFQTLNIIYRTIIETNAKPKPKPHFEVNAKKLPILQKFTYHSKELKRGFETPIRKTSSSREGEYPRNSNNDKLSLMIKKQVAKNRQKSQSPFSLFEQNEETNMFSRRRRFDYRSQSSRGNNEIIPWGQRTDIEPQTIFGG